MAARFINDLGTALEALDIETKELWLSPQFNGIKYWPFTVNKYGNRSDFYV